MLTTNITLAEKYDYLSDKFKKEKQILHHFRSEEQRLMEMKFMQVCRAIQL